MAFERMKYLYGRCASGDAAPEEQQELLQLMQQDNALARDLYRYAYEEEKEHVDIPEEKAAYIYNAIVGIPAQGQKSGNGTMRQLRWWLAAAAVISAIVVTVFWWRGEKPQSAASVSTKENHNNILPVGNKAFLLLADGSKVELKNAPDGAIANEHGVQVIKTGDGRIEYKGSSSEIQYNVLATPSGGQYMITLPDGTKVWLNASSSIKYPVSFPGNERKVEMTGEAYFEVAKNAARPFYVQVQNVEVRVLGTHFNINSYTDESSVNTTLLEGKVQVTTNGESKALNPGQQAQLDRSGKLQVTANVDLEQVIAWKNGDFQFDNDDIHTVMRQVARWYNTEVEYMGVVSNRFGGSISRNTPLTKVLSMLSATGKVKFTVDNNKIIVQAVNN